MQTKKDLKYYISQCIIPVKYAYTSSAASYHKIFSKSKDYKDNVKIENKKYDLLIPYLRNERYDYLEIGGDDGDISLQIIEHLSNNNVSFNNYFFVDFSHELLSDCQKNISARIPNDLCKFIPYDLEQPNKCIPIDINNKKIIMFLGNTLGNVESEDDVLKNIYNSMNKDDLFLIGLTFWNDKTNELDNYDNELFRESVLEYLRIININTKTDNYCLKFDQINHTVICEYTLDEPYKYDNVQLNKGTIIRCFQSRRYSQEYCERMFSKNGFVILEYQNDETMRHTLFLLKKNPLQGV